MRIRIQDLPQAVRDRLIVAVQNQNIASLIAAASTTPGNVGWIYMMFAHQNYVQFSTDKNEPYPLVETWDYLGETGNSGLDDPTDINLHLDVSVFYVSGPISNVNGINVPARMPETNAFDAYDFNMYFSLYKAAYAPFSPTAATTVPYTLFGYVELIDPLIIWPRLSEGVSGIDYECP